MRLESFARKPRGYFLFRPKLQSGFAVGNINRSHFQEYLERLMNVPPWSADNLVVRARDTNGLVFEEDTNLLPLIASQLLALLCLFEILRVQFLGSSYIGKLIRSMRENKNNAESKFSAT